MAGWWQRWRDWRAARTLERRPIPDELWRLTLARFPFLAHRPAPAVDRLRAMATLFLDDKEFTGAGGLEVSDEMAVAIAAQACLPVLELGLSWYDGFKGIVVHPDVVVARREIVDEDGIVHRYEEELSGEAMEGGPVMLSWQDVADAGESAEWGYNVVVHEFAHVIDMRDGASDGVPPLPDRAAHAHWCAVIDTEWERFGAEVDAGHDTLLDPYGAEGVDEFFAVASEAFFVVPGAMRREHPALYELMRGFYRQDTAAESP